MLGVLLFLVYVLVYLSLGFVTYMVTLYFFPQCIIRIVRDKNYAEHIPLFLAAWPMLPFVFLINWIGEYVNEKSINGFLDKIVVLSQNRKQDKE